MSIREWIDPAIVAACAIATIAASVHFAPGCDINSPSVRIGYVLVAGCDNETGRSRGLSFPAR